MKDGSFSSTTFSSVHYKTEQGLWVASCVALKNELALAALLLLYQQVSSYPTKLGPFRIFVKTQTDFYEIATAVTVYV